MIVRAWSPETGSKNRCRLSTSSAHSIRSRRSGGSSSRGALLPSRRDIISKSNWSRCREPNAACRLSGRRPGSEWMKAARRMSDSACTSRSTSAWKRRAFWRWTLCQACADHTPRKLVIAVGELAVDLQVSGRVGEVRRCSRPEIRQHPACALGDEPADLALGTKDISAHPFPLDAARSAVPEHVVDERGQRAYACFVDRIVNQHDGVVVAESRKIAIGRQQRRPHRGVDGLEVPARRSRQVERDLPLDFGRLFHDHAAARSSPAGQTVNLSSSASRLARMRSAGRAWPAPRSSS